MTDKPSKTVLLVEAEFLIREVLREFLERLGFEVEAFENADTALSYLRQNQSSHWDLVFTDVGMPGQIDGLEFAAIIRGFFPTVPIIIASGLFVPPERRPSLSGFVLKPSRDEDLATLIADLLQRAEKARSSKEKDLEGDTL